MKRTFTARNGDKFSLSWLRGDPTCSLNIYVKDHAKQKTGFNEDQVVEEVTDLVAQLPIDRKPAIAFAKDIEREMKDWWKKKGQYHVLILWDTKHDKPALNDFDDDELEENKRFVTKTNKNELARILSLSWLLKGAQLYSTATMFEENFERILRSELHSIYESKEGSIVATFAEKSSEPILMKILEVGEDKVRVLRHREEGVVIEPLLVTRNISWLLVRGEFISERIRLIWYLARYNKTIRNNLY